MSVFTLERVLFDVASSPERTKTYKSDEATYLKGFPLAPDEADLVRNLDVREIVKRGVNPMLVQRAFMAIEGSQAAPEYFRRLREV